MGATTIWERWNGIRPDSSFEPASMNSFNHYAYGAIGDWMYRVVAGLDTDTDGPGYKKIIIKPHPGGGLTHASAVLQTYYGQTASSWKTDNGKLIIDIDVPVNTRATVFLPANNPDQISENGVSISGSEYFRVTGSENGYIKVEAGSGKYHFEIIN